MKEKAFPIGMYAVTALTLAAFFDALYGAGPITRHLGPIHLAIAGTVLFAVACALSLFALRIGVVCGLAGAVLSWPIFLFKCLRCLGATYCRSCPMLTGGTY